MNEVKLDFHGDFHSGDPVYFNHPTESWIRGTLATIKRVNKKDGLTQVIYGCSPLLRDRYLPTLSSNQSSEEIYYLKKSDIHHVIASCVEPTAVTTLNDLLELSYLHDAPLLEQIRVRYYENLIYTHIGPIILALNPYNFALPNYTEDMMPNYIREGCEVLEAQSKNLPHAWTTAHYSYWLMNVNGRNQSIIVSGESGAGKTETVKIVLKYIGIVSTTQCDLQLKSEAEEITQKVNLTSPILEAFGNAKTKKNDNSSRFGKFMKVFFNHSTTGSVMTGATIKVYLLEKSRIVTHSEDERGYHSFYQLLACGAADTKKEQLLKRLQLQRAEDYHCTAVGGATRIEGVNDAADFDEVVRAMKFVGITETELTGVWNIVAAVLHLLALNFRALTDDECCIDSTAHGAEGHERMITELLGLPDASFFTELITTTTQVTRAETIVRKLRRAQAIDLRDGVAKALYEALFLWLVDKINGLIEVPADKAKGNKVSWIGLLDIFGFENFAHGNSFEQLCINLANETLQNHYNSVIFTRDMEECKSEGINTESVVFYDNQPCLDLICGTNFAGCGPGGAAKVTNTMSLFHLLDDESSLAKGDDFVFRDKVCEAYGGQFPDGKGSHVNFETVKTDRGSFIVRHYAGNVAYKVEGFRIKNSDTIKETLKDAIRASTIPLVASLFDVKLSESSSSIKSTVGSFFRNQLVLLMTEINGTHPHWIRCIKPHSSKRPLMFNGEEVMSQMRSAGVLETVKIRQNSFSVRIPFSDFVRAHRLLIEPLPMSVYSFAPNDYAVSLRAPLHSTGESMRDQAALVLRRGVVVETSRGQIGRTRVFLKAEASQHLGSIVRSLQKGCVVLVQSFTRQNMSMRRTHLRNLRRHLFTITAWAHSILSQQRMRCAELRCKETFLLVVFRDILILQGQEAVARGALWRSEADSLDAALTDCHAQWCAIRAAQFTTLESDMCAVREEILCVEAEARLCLSRFLSLLAQEVDARDEIEIEESTRQRAEVCAAYANLRAHRALIDRATLESTESDARVMITQCEAFATASTSLQLSECAARDSIHSAEASSRGLHLLPEAAALRRRGTVRRALTDRRALLLLQRDESAARRSELCAEALQAAELVTQFGAGEAHAAQRAARRLEAEAAERRAIAAEAALRQSEEARAAAKAAWRAAAHERALVRERLEAEAAEREARVAFGRHTEAFAMLYRRREAAKAARAPSDAREAEEIRRQKRGLAKALADAVQRRKEAVIALAAWQAQRQCREEEKQKQKEKEENENENENESEEEEAEAEEAKTPSKGRAEWARARRSRGAESIERTAAAAVSAEGSMELVRRMQCARRAQSHSRAGEWSAAGMDCAALERSPFRGGRWSEKLCDAGRALGAGM